MHFIHIIHTYLTVREQTDIVPIQSRLDKLGNLGKHLFLGNLRLEDPIEREAVLLLLVALERQFERHVVGLGLDRGNIGVTGTVSGQKGTDAGKHPDVAPQLLDGVVHPAPLSGPGVELGLEVGFFFLERFLGGCGLGLLGLEVLFHGGNVGLELGNGGGMLGILLGLAFNGFLEGGNFLLQTLNSFLQLGHIALLLRLHLLQGLGMLGLLGLKPLLEVGNGTLALGQLLLLLLELLVVRLRLFLQPGLQLSGGLLPLGLGRLVLPHQLGELDGQFLGRLGVEQGGIVDLVIVVELLFLAVELRSRTSQRGIRRRLGGGVGLDFGQCGSGGGLGQGGRLGGRGGRRFGQLPAPGNDLGLEAVHGHTSTSCVCYVPSYVLET